MSFPGKLKRLTILGEAVYRGSDRVAEQPWIDRLATAADQLDLEAETVSVARDLYLSELPVEDRSKPALLAASCYTATLISGDERSQSAVANAFDVSRIAIQQRWKALLEDAGMSPPRW